MVYKIIQFNDGDKIMIIKTSAVKCTVRTAEVRTVDYNNNLKYCCNKIFVTPVQIYNNSNLL
jgi:hypothetical protein